MGSRREHEGRTPQPGVPSGSRNTPKKKPVVRIPSTHEVREHEGKIKTQPLPPGPKVRQERKARGELVSPKARLRARIKSGPAWQSTLQAAAKEMPANPELEYLQAKQSGREPSAKLKKELPDAYSKALKAFGEYHAKHEGVKEDPAAEFVIDTAATAGLGGIEAGVTKLAAKEGAEEGAGLLSRAAKGVASKETSGAETVAEKVGKKVIAKVKGKATKVKSTPERVRTAPARARKAASTAEGRKDAARVAAKTTAKHPLRAGYAGAVVLPEGVLPGDATKRARAFAEGSADAALHHPGETFKTTARGLEGVITGPVDLAAAGVDSAIHRTPAPLIKTAKEQVKGVSHIVGTAFSGDTKKAEEAARKEGSLSILTPIPALSKTRIGRTAADEVRDVSSAVRRKVATTEKLPAKEFRNRAIRHAPKEADEHATGLSERHFIRKRTSEAWQRIHNKHSVPADRHAGKILSDLAKAPKGSSIALQTMAEYGIRDEHQADYIREHGTGDKQLLAALDYAKLHPEIFEDKAFADALKHSEEAVAGHPAAKAQVGERARLLPLGDALGVPRPEAVIPFHKRDVFGNGTWAEAVDRLKRLRKSQRKALAADPGSAEIHSDMERTAEMLKEAKKGAKRKANVRQKTQTITLEDGTKKKVKTKIAPYGDKELKEYADRVESARKPEGFAAPIWTHHSKADSEKGVDLNLGPTAAKKEYAREGHLAREDNLDRSLEGFIRGTVQRPRYNAANKEFLQHIAEDEKIKGLTLDGKPFDLGHGSADWKRLTERRSKENPEGGQIDPRSVTRFPLRQWEHAVDDPFKTDSQRSDEMVSILKAAREGRVQGNEPWIPVHREALKEAEGQIHANHNEFVKFVNSGNRVAGRALLATNPAWLVAQSVAEAVPAIVSHPSLASPLHLPVLLRTIYKDRKDNPEQAMAVQAAAGAAPTNGRYLNTPIDEEGVMTPETWNKSAQAMTRGKSLKAVLSFSKLRTLPELDVHRQNLYRELIYRAQADKKFRKWYSGTTGLFDGAAEISKRFKGKSDKELQEWLQSDDPQAKYWNKKLTEHVDAVAGNWGAFTRFEKSAAPFIIFYPFLRYSLRWALWAFPKEHPIKATILSLMGQANANQLEKMIGHPLENPAQYAEPVYTTANGEKATLPAGTRISPAQSSITQAASTGNPSALAQSLNPGVAAAATYVFGIDPWTGEKIKGESQAQAALNELLALPAPLRLAGVKVGAGPSPGSQAFEQFNEHKDLRSVGFPFIPQSGADFKGEQKLSKAFHDKYANPVPSLPPEIWEAAYNHDWKLAKELRAKRVAGEKGGDVVKTAEEPFFTDSGGELGDEGSKILQYITGTIQIPAEEKKKTKTGQYGSGSGQYSGGSGQYSSSNGQYSSGAGQYGGG